ncbi:hypothetical protein CXQ85_004621 [Candidozyma haemuli]|uniref:Alpha/beta hydrolase fold-3 domain-containing protein n=1 Tax=Candidozyma haemuli TaxID=45357 RepID=A0A2V1AWR5_9ASCO|nr:hypothetical protein CXQ85_004621 [[Candida] haemuloni]PVH21956.1 hypothetical protein CXQ85_004621 [[Candida] haemuloni]
MPSLASRLTVPSPRLTLGVVSVPWVAVKAITQYYTTGTVYQKTDPEFDTLYKNVLVAVLATLATTASATDAKLMPYPMNAMFKKQRGRGAAKDMPRFGEPLTTYGKYYPTQLFEAVEAYRELVNQGYEVIVMGDSCGSNLAMAVARYAAYPEEAEAHFSSYTQFDWDFSSVAAPRHLILLAPWTSPTCAAVPINKKGQLYIKGSEKDEVASFVEFNDTNYKEHWAEVPAFNGNGSVLYIYGEREYFRASQEQFAEECGLHNFKSLMQPGGIHDCLFVVEVLDISSKKGQAAMVRGEHRKKYNFGAIADYLDEIL